MFAEIKFKIPLFLIKTGKIVETLELHTMFHWIKYEFVRFTSHCILCFIYISHNVPAFSGLGLYVEFNFTCVFIDLRRYLRGSARWGWTSSCWLGSWSTLSAEKHKSTTSVSKNRTSVIDLHWWTLCYLVLLGNENLSIFKDTVADVPYGDLLRRGPVQSWKFSGCSWRRFSLPHIWHTNKSNHYSCFSSAGRYKRWVVSLSRADCDVLKCASWCQTRAHSCLSQFVFLTQSLPFHR